MPSQLSDWTLPPANQTPRMRVERVLHMYVWALRRKSSKERAPQVTQQNTCCAEADMHACGRCMQKTDRQNNQGKRPPSPPTKPIVSYKDHKKHRRHQSEDPQPAR